ncbi:MAG: orotate phosphoribosyltransferase [Patescibacteria group bacterium]|nr:orotate phosphoribosyltransferase [Patescibacteria group bacterium]
MRGAFKFGAFKLKLHEKNPGAPLSPFFIHLRNKTNPKPGPLIEKDYLLIAKCLLETISQSDFVFDAIAGIPRAGDPIVDAIQWMQEYDPKFQQGDFRIIRLAKEEKDGLRKIVPLPGFEYRKDERVLLIDDLVTKADTKLEAIRAVESQGAIVVGVVVLVDRQQGGKNELEKAGYKLLASLTVRDLFNFYFQTEMISAEKYQEAINYVSNN